MEHTKFDTAINWLTGVCVFVFVVHVLIPIATGMPSLFKVLFTCNY